MSLQELKLKKGVIVMLLRNLNIGQGLCNGTRLKITRMFDHCVEGEILTGNSKGNLAVIPRIKLISNTTKIPFKLARIQLPLVIAFAMTINKSQGQSFNKVGLFL